MAFHPSPVSSHGRSWERLVWSVKTAIWATLKEQFQKEEVLQTLFVEVESIVNSRPLTHVSLDHEDGEALTPNHFLLGTSSAVQPPGYFLKSDICLWKQWKVVKALTDLF